MTKLLTERQADILDFINYYSQRLVFSPTILEIKQQFGFNSINSVQCHLKALKRKGYISYVFRKARTIKITSKGATAIHKRMTGGKG